MKIVFTGGGTGGHFYPIIAVAARIREDVLQRHLVDPTLLYIGPKPFDAAALSEYNIQYRMAPGGKLRRHSSAIDVIRNALDSFKTVGGILSSIFHLFVIYPDVVFSTGGYAAFPTLVAARILLIPTIIYDADAEPGRTSLYAAKFARWIGIAHAEAAHKFPSRVHSKIALIGHPIRKEIENVSPAGGHEFLKIDASIPTIFVMGGSTGSQAINNAIIDALPLLIEKYNIIHQTGRDNIAEVQGIATAILKNGAYENRYRAFGLLNTLALRMTAGISTLIIARAGSGTIFEIASWGVPSILIPIPEDVSHDQIKNAFSYARTGAAHVIEQKNLTQHLLCAEIERILSNPAELESMKAAAKAFSTKDAAEKIAHILINTALTHEN